MKVVLAYISEHYFEVNLKRFFVQEQCFFIESQYSFFQKCAANIFNIFIAELALLLTGIHFIYTES